MTLSMGGLSMEHITDEMLLQALSSLGQRFDAHDLEHRILRDFPIAFARDLLRYEASDDPLLRFSAQFARFADRRLAGRIRQTGKVRSLNLGGVESDNQEWEQIPAIQTGSSRA
jgi:hypothetical protein